MSDVTYDEQSRTWLLRTPASSYGIGLSDDGRSVRHLHWGAPIDPEDLRDLAGAGYRARHVEQIAWGSEEPVEYVGWGAARYDEPSLQVDYADGTRGIEWHYRGQRVTRHGDATTLVVELADLVYPLDVELCYRVFDDSDVIERWARLSHRGNEGTIVVRRSHSATWSLPRRDRWRLRYLHGGWGTETQLAETILGPGKVVLDSTRGTTSHQLNPWFSLDADGSATEDYGEVWSGELAWSGSWKLVIETTPGGHLRASGGWNDFDSPLDLAPGGEIVAPVFAALYTRGGAGGASRAWHAYQLAHVLSRPGRDGASPSFPARGDGPAPSGRSLPPLRPILYNSWEATYFSVDEAGQARLAERAAAMGVELFVVDDGWFVGRNHDHAGLGDWFVDPAKFLHGLGPLIDRVHGLGMKFGLWLEPEMVNPDSDLYRSHPDWVFHFENRGRSQRRHQLVLNLGRPDVAEWVYDTLDRVLSENAIEFVKWDMNRHISEPGWPAQAGHNPERAWVDHTRNLYRILDRLRAAHPGVDIESCSGGGGRVDLGILARTQQVWTSDNTDAWDRIAIQEGFSHAYAPLAMMAWVTDSPNPISGRRLPLRYRFHVAMAGSLGVGGNLTEWSPDELAEAKELVATYKAIRPVVQHGRLYRLASIAAGPLAAVEYVAADDAQVVVLAWWGPRHYQTVATRLRLVNLDPAARYRDVATGQEHRGAVLVELGLELSGDLDFDSMLVHLVKVDPTA